MINRISHEKSIVLNGENNTKQKFLDIATKDYTHVFICSEIAFSKKFKQNILDKSSFTNYLCLLAINKIHFVEKWDKNNSKVI